MIRIENILKEPCNKKYYNIYTVTLNMRHFYKVILGTLTFLRTDLRNAATVQPPSFTRTVYCRLSYKTRTFPVIQVILGVKTSCADGGSSRGGRPLRLCFGGGGSSDSPSRKTVSTPGVPVPGLWPELFRSFCVGSLRQLTSASPLMCKSSAVFSNDDNLVYKANLTNIIYSLMPVISI